MSPLVPGRALLTPFAVALVGTALLWGGASDARRRAARPVAPPLELKADVNARKVRVGDVFQLDVALVIQGTAQPEELVLPDLSDFKVVRSQRGPTSASTTLINGRMTTSQSFSYTYLLRADTPGRKRVGPARARVGKAVATTEPILIEVVEQEAGAGGHSSELDPDARFPEGEDLPPFFLDVRFDKDQVYTGEQAVLTVQMFARDQVEIEVRNLDKPEPPGFWVEVLESPSRVRPTQRSLRGQVYLVYPLLRLALFPLEAGEHTLEPLTLVVTVSRGGIWGRRREVPLTSEPVKLVALPLPNEGRPASFAEGNVGHFVLKAGLDKREVPLGQPVTLRVSISGEGNVGAVELPDVAGALEGARVFPPSTSAKKAVSQGRLTGEKTQELLVQPTKEGPFTIPSFSFAFFDPVEGRYRSARTEPVTVRVTPSQVSAGRGARPGIVKGARPIARRLDVDERPLAMRPLYLAGLVASLVFGLVLFISGARVRARAASPGGRRDKARRARGRALDEAREAKDLAAAERVLLDALSAHAGEEVRALPSDQLAGALVARGLEDGLAAALASFFAAAQAARYAPRGGEGRRQLFDAAASLLARVEEAP